MKEKRQDTSSTEEGNEARARNLAWEKVRKARAYTSKTLHLNDMMDDWLGHCPDFMKGQCAYGTVEKMYKQIWDEYRRADKADEEAFEEMRRLEDGEK